MNSQQKKRAAIAGGVGFALLAVGSMAVFMDSKKIDLSSNVGTLDLTADAVLTHSNAYAEATPNGNTGLQANNINPGDNDHTVDAEAAVATEVSRDGTDHELNIHIQNDGNKSMITRTLIVVTGETDGIHPDAAGNTDKKPLTNQALKNVLLYLNDAQNDSKDVALLPKLDTKPDGARDAGITSQAPDGVTKIPYTVWPVTSTKTPADANARYLYQTWNETNNTVGVLPSANAGADVMHTSIQKTLNRTVTAEERKTQLNPAKGGTTQVNTGKTEKLIPLNGENQDSLRPAYWSAQDIAKLWAPVAGGAGYGIKNAEALVYEVHRNMVLGGSVKAPGVTEYETLEVAMGKTTDPTALAKAGQLVDNQPYFNKTAFEADPTDKTKPGNKNMVPSSKEFVIEIGLDHRVGKLQTADETINASTNKYLAGTYYHPEIEGATLKFKVIVQAMQFRNTSDQLWKTLFTKDISVNVA